MKKRQLRLGWFLMFGIAMTVAAIYGADVLAQTNGSRTEAISCVDRLRQAMNEMHTVVHTIERSGDVDEEFVRLMLPHHQAAIEMAKIELLCGKDDANRRLAQEIIVDQQSEIDLMRRWLSKRTSSKALSSPHHEEVQKP